MTFIVKRIVNFTITTSWNNLTTCWTWKCWYRTCTGINEWIPYFTICACNLRWKACIIYENFIIRALAWFYWLIPNLTFCTRISNTKVAIPIWQRRALTTPWALIPLFTTCTRLGELATVFSDICSWRACAIESCYVPNLTVNTLYTILTIPLKTF